MAYSTTASLYEQKLAKQFLRALGLSDRRVKDPSNIIAIVAWFRVVNPAGLGHIQHNNLFGVRAGQLGAAKYGHGTYRRGGVWYVKYRSIGEAIKGAAFAMKLGRKSDDLGRALRALQLGKGSNFLVYLALSAWSTTHYGVPPGGNVLDPFINDLLKAQRHIKGFAQLVKRLVKKITKQIAKAMKPPVPHPGPPPAATPYIDPYAVQKWYMRRHGEVPSET
jgi:hypothetical protein